MLDPIPVVIDNLPEDYLEMIELPFSKDLDFGVCDFHAHFRCPLNNSFLLSHILFLSRKQST